MYTIQAVISGTAGLLQHAFGQASMATLQENAKKQTGTPDYSLEWMSTMYTTRDGLLYQPASHIEGALQRAASGFKQKGKGGKTWKDAVKAYAYVLPDEIPHLRDGECVPAPTADLLKHPTEYLSVSIMRVKVQRAAVARSRLLIAPGWQLAFTIQVQDDQLRPDVVRPILEEAGRAVGIGDYRPRYGRFEVAEFRVADDALATAGIG
jgi:hypothetical protein